MASGADGSIIIDTQLDNTGFQRGSKQMQNAVNSLNSSVNQAGQNMSSAVQSMNTALHSMGAAAQTAGSKVTEAMGSGQFDKALGTIQKSVNSLAGQLTRLSDTERIGISGSAGMTRFTINVEKARDTLTTLSQKLMELGGQQVNTTQYEQLQAEFIKLDGEMERLYQKQEMFNALGVSVDSAQYDRLAYQIDTVGKKYDAVLEKIRALHQDGGEATPGADSSQYQQIAQQLAEMANELQHFEQVSAGFGGQLQEGSQGSEQSLSSLDRKLQQEPSNASGASSALSGLGNTLKSVGSFALRAVAGLAKLSFKGISAGVKGAVSGIQKFNTALKNLRNHGKKSVLTSNGIVKALSSVKRMLLTRIKRTFISSMFNSMKAGMQSFAQYSSGFNSAMSSMKNSMTGVSGNLAVFAGNLISAIAPAISTIIDWISQAITYLNAFFSLLSGKSTYSVAKKGTDDYAKSLKGAGGAAKDLKNQVYGFDELNKEDDSSGGGGGGGSSGSVDFTEESLESLPGSLQNFMQSIKDAFAAENFEEVGAIVGRGLNTIITTVDDWVNSTFRPAATMWSRNIARILNGFVSAFDWTTLGKLFADGFNGIVDTINSFLTTFDFDALAQAFGDGINGIFNNVDWELLGQTAGNGISNLKNLIWGALASINWVTLGSGLATGVNNMFSAVDWAKWGANVSESLKGVINGINQFLLDTDWQAIGNDIATFVGAIDWNGLVDSLMTGIGLALASIGEAIWGLIEPAWNSVVEWWNADMDKNGGDVIATLLDGIIAALVNIGQWCNDHIITPILSGIETALGLEQGTIAATATQLWDDFAGAIEDAWNAISGAVATFFTDVWDSIVGFFGTLGDTATAIWDGFSEGVSSAWNSISSAVDGVLTDAWNAITGAFGSLSETASDIWNGFSDALSSAWNTVSGAVVDVFTGAWDAITGVFSDVATVASNLWEGLKDGLVNGWTTFTDAILQPFKDMWQAVKDFFGIASPSTEAASIGDFILQGLVNGFSSAVEGVITTVTAIFGRIWDAIKSIFGFGGESDESKEAKQAGKDIMTGMKDGITGDEETVKTEIKNVAKEALKALRTELGVPESGSGASTKTKPYGESIVEGLAEGISTKGVAETFTNVANNAWSAVQSALNTAFGTEEGGSASKVEYVGETIVQGINDGIDSKAENSTFSTAATATLDAIKGALNSAFGMASDTSSATKTKPVGEGIVKGISDGIKEKGVESTFSSVATTVGNEIAGAFNSALGISGGNWFSSASASKFYDVGKAICQGVADGINTNVSTIKTAAESAAKAALQAAKNKLGIHSPSKAFAEIGDYMMQGMSNGLKDGQGEVAHTVSSIAASLTDGMGGTTFDVGADAMVSGMDRVADKFMQFVQQLNAVTDALAGGMLQQPAIATGNYAPPRVRVDSMEGDSATDGMSNFTRNFDETMSDQRDVLREILDVLRSKNLTIDGSSLERTLNTLQRDRVRAYGGAY